MKHYEMHVISNTHWDREWSCDFQETRMQLIEFIDGLLDILDREPGYRAFHLDSQTVPIEDYLEARPENAERVKKHVTDNRLIIGPWYTCPEEFSVNGESIVRNLLVGHRVANAFGGVMKVGYSPFSYGQNSQMPQIYSGFGIDTMLFYHGVTHDEVSNEYILEGTDGTRVLASQISSMARYNFYHRVYHMVMKDEVEDTRIYTWELGGLPFHRCTQERCEGQYALLDVPRRFASKRIEKSITDLRAQEIEVATTPYLAFMMGHDASVADDAVVRIIDEAQQYIGEDKLFHSTLQDWMDKVKGSVKDLPVLKGERRTPKVRTGRVHLYSDVLSSRTRMKRRNAMAETILQRWAEPYASLAWWLGGEYPEVLLEKAWKELLKGHAHDSIAGSGVDDIEEDMNYRLRQVHNISQGILTRSLAQIQRRIDNSNADKDDVLLTVFNASPFARSEVVTAVVDIPPHRASREFDLIAADSGESVPVQIATRKPYHVVVNHSGDAAHTMACERAVIHMDAHNLPAMGYTTLKLNPEGRFARGELVSGQNAMENEHLAVRIQSDGTLSVKHKASGIEYNGLHYLEDSGEAGQAWMHVEPGIDSVLTSHGFPVSVALEESGPLLARYRIEYYMTIPAGLDNAGSNAWERLDGFDNAACRTKETRELVVTSFVTLRKGARAVEVRTRFSNNAERHRLRVMFPTQIADAEYCYAETPFDVVERPIEPGPESPWHGIGRRTYPMQRFVDVNDGKNGLSIINDGIREYEVTQDPERTIAVTLLRAYEVSVCTSAAGWEIHPEMKLSQCPGDHEFRYLIYPHAGGWAEANVQGEADRLNVPVELAQTGAHAGDLPQRQSLLEIAPANLSLSALKQSEDGAAVVLRLHNATEEAIQGKITLFRKIKSAELLTLEEKPLKEVKPSGSSLDIEVGSRKIVTVKLMLD